MLIKHVLGNVKSGLLTLDFNIVYITEKMKWNLIGVGRFEYWGWRQGSEYWGVGGGGGGGGGQGGARGDANVSLAVH